MRAPDGARIRAYLSPRVASSARICPATNRGSVIFGGKVIPKESSVKHFNYFDIKELEDPPEAPTVGEQGRPNSPMDIGEPCQRQPSPTRPNATDESSRQNPIATPFHASKQHLADRLSRRSAHSHWRSPAPAPGCAHRHRPALRSATASGRPSRQHKLVLGDMQMQGLRGAERPSGIPRQPVTGYKRIVTHRYYFVFFCPK